jgi:hypothetical protein
MSQVVADVLSVGIQSAVRAARQVMGDIYGRKQRD